MKPILPLLAGLALAPLAALAQPDTTRTAPIPSNSAEMPRLVIGAPGRCELATAGRPQPCSSGLVLVHNSNGAILISVQSSPTTTIGFAGNSDSQPRPEEYTLNVARMHTTISGQTASKSVTGTCRIEMTTDGQTWHRATCRVRDGNGMETVMTFTGDGRTVTASRPGQEGQGGGAPRQAPTPQAPTPQGGARKG